MLQKIKELMEGEEPDYDLILAIVNFIKAIKHLTDLLNIESIYKLEKQIMSLKIKAANKEILKVEDERIKKLSENII